MHHQLISQVLGMAEAANIILCHEERYDGSGYPAGLSGNNIPLGARLFMVIDTLDAITSDRPYRKGDSFGAAKKEILRMAGSQFDPNIVDAFRAEEEVLREMVIANRYCGYRYSRCSRCRRRDRQGRGRARISTSKAMKGAELLAARYSINAAR